MPDINVKLVRDPKVSDTHDACDDSNRFSIFNSVAIVGQASIRSRFATLTVLVPPEPPVIAQGDFIQSTENKEIELHCESIGGKPAATVSVYWVERWKVGMGVN